MTTILLEFAIRTSLIAAGTAGVLWMLRIKAAKVHHAAWSAVVVMMLLLPLTLTGGIRLSLPVLAPESTATNKAANHTPSQPSVDAPAPEPLIPATSEPVVTPSAPPAARRIDWSAFFIGGYLTGALMLLVRLGIGTVQANRLRRHATMHDGRLTSDRCTTPITVGWFKPALILPRGWDHWSSEQLAVVLTHEQEHARRHDPLFQWLALLNRAVFWFHPLSWWLERRLATLAEEACDAAVIAAGHSPQDYSEYLLEMARAVAANGGRVRLGMAMPGVGLSDRLRLILKGLPAGRVSRARLVCAVAFCAASSAIFAAGTLAERAVQQETGQPAITFDVVSIKPCLGLPPRGVGRGAPPWAGQITPGYVHWDCVTLSQLIDEAYAGSQSPLLNMLGFDRGRDDSPKRVRGGPSWVESDLFTIEAKVSGDTGRPELNGSARHVYLRGAIQPAVRALLEDRFQLKWHRATEQQSMYALTIAKSGIDKSKIVKITPGVDCWVWDPATNRTAAPAGSERLPMCENMHGGFSLARQAGVKAGQNPAAITVTTPNLRRLEFTGFSMQGFAEQLSTMMDRFVLDQTGLSGDFSFAFEYEPDEHTPARGRGVASDTRTVRGSISLGDPATPKPRGDGPTIFKALEALGLKLEPTKGPAEYLQIDGAQRPKPDAPASAEAAAGSPAPARSQGAGPSGSPAEGDDDRQPSAEMATTPVAQAAAQTPSSPAMQIKFDVVSIKPCPDVSAAQTGRGAGPNLAQTSPGRVFWACVTLASLVDQAFAGLDFPLLNVADDPIAFEGLPGERPDPRKRVRGGPAWMYADRFTIEATAPVDVINPPKGAVNLMRLPAPMNAALRAMLVDRFQLKLRRETEELPMYGLTVAKSGLKAKPRAPGDCEVPPSVRPPGTQGRPTFDGFFEGKWSCGTFWTAPLGMQARIWAGEAMATVKATTELDRRYEYRGVTMQAVANHLAHAMDRWVLDQTGLAGEFLLAVEFKGDETTVGTGFFLTTSRPDYGAARRPETPTGSGGTIFKAFDTLGLKLAPTKGPAEYLEIDRVEKPSPDFAEAQRAKADR